VPAPSSSAVESSAATELKRIAARSKTVVEKIEALRLQYMKAAAKFAMLDCEKRRMAGLVTVEALASAYTDFMPAPRITDITPQSTGSVDWTDVRIARTTLQNLQFDLANETRRVNSLNKVLVETGGCPMIDSNNAVKTLGEMHEMVKQRLGELKLQRQLERAERPRRRR
jgi:hypothetical protein